MTKQCGVIYLAFGPAYLIMALHSIRSLRQTNPDLPVTLVTNLDFPKSGIPTLTEDDTLIVLGDDQSRNRLLKTSINQMSEYDKTVFLDCDTIVLGELGSGFDFLDYFDVACRLNPYPQTRKGKAEVPVLDNLSIRDCPHWNSGVMFFRKSEATNRFFTKWNKHFAELGNQYDQVSLVKTIFEDQARVLSLDAKWNASDPILGRRRWRKRTRVFHYASNISNKLRGELEQEAASLPKEVEVVKDATSQVATFVSRKRSQKRQEIGLLRYFVAKVLWSFTSPV